MNRTVRAAVFVVLGAAAFVLAARQAPLGAQTAVSPGYTAAQAREGEETYTQACASCHGAALDDGQFGAPLRGGAFLERWGGKSVESLFTYTATRMPPAGPGSLSADRYAAVVAYLLGRNGVAPGTRALPADADALRSMVLPVAGPGPGGGLTSGVALPPAPSRPNPLARLTPVTEAMLVSPPDGSWLNWRRTYDAHGFSPLKQIAKANVASLRLAWTWSLPNGPSEATPLVHDGVIFVHGYGDKVQALDAVTGDLLWEYSRRLPRGAAPSWKRNLSISGTRLYVPTSDTHIVALDARTGDVVWDTPVADVSKGYALTGGPLVARGKVMVGTNGRTPGGNLIVALDAETGAEAWRFHAIAQPGTPEGDTWNGLPVEKRNGGSVWVAGTYDPVLNLAFFGPAPTYDTGPLRDLAPGAKSNAALYTNATIAINPDTGTLVWYYQHLANDQWDYDWAFERQLITLPGRSKTVVLTGGKQMIFDALEADAGKYLFSFDLGLQNVITAIDPKTGAKTIDQRLVPGDGTAKMTCPHAGGGRSWLPTSYNAATRIIYVPMVESCMDLTPVGAGERGSLSTGVRWSLRPRPDSDGKYGRLEAINVETRKPVWTERQRAPQTTGVLATAGGLVFAGSYDRYFTAYDDGTGKTLWRARLNDAPNTSPVTFMANGRQYLAITVGSGGPQVATYPNMTPEIVNQPGARATLWVFELPRP
jgi:alcohol dehydrogenase (cytochrome c)